MAYGSEKFNVSVQKNQFFKKSLRCMYVSLMFLYFEDYF
jgi:3-methyladenine DNA glycosylase AlkC